MPHINFLYRIKFSSLVILLFIFLIGLFFRFNNLANNPPSLNWDEVSFAYNAHSIVDTGKDEFGMRFPLYFRSLDDYKLPVYVYMTVISEKIFGYNNFAVRFPSALSGSLTIILVYFLCVVILKNRKIALISALVFAITPWHIQFSRMAAESTVGLFFFLAGLILFLYSAKSRFWLLPFSILLFFISQYTYLTFRFITPLFLIVLVIIYGKKFLKKNIAIYATCGLLIIFSMVLGYDSFVNRNSSRINGIAAVTPYNDEYQQDISDLRYDGTLNINIPRRIFHDSHFFSSLDIISHNYLFHFSPQFLFYNLGQPRHYTPMFGLLYLWMIPFILTGTYFLIRMSFRSFVLLFSLLLIVPIPSAFVFDAPNAIRTTTLVVPFCILTALGIYKIHRKLDGTRSMFSYIYIIAVISVISFYSYYFYHQNTIHLPQNRSADWQYGRKEMTAYILAHQKEYSKIIVSTKLQWPNIFFLYYSKYSPKRYLSERGTKSGSWSAENNKIENIEFHRFNCSPGVIGSKNLYVGEPDEFPKESHPVYTINYLNDKPAIYVVDSSKSFLDCK